MLSSGTHGAQRKLVGWQVQDEVLKKLSRNVHLNSNWVLGSLSQTSGTALVHLKSICMSLMCNVFGSNQILVKILKLQVRLVKSRSSGGTRTVIQIQFMIQFNLVLRFRLVRVRAK